MYVKVTGTLEDPCVSVEEGDDCTRLHITARGFEENEVVAVLATTGLGLGRRGVPGHVWLAIDVLRSRSHGDVPGWAQRFDDMIDHARRSGWCDAGEKLVAAHIAR